MKLFGEYLVERDMISSDVLAQALVEQIKGLPSVPEVVLHKNLLKSEEVLLVFRHQHEKKTSFVDAATALGLWTSNVAQEVDRLVGACRMPLGQILIKMGAVSLEVVTHALDDFLAEIESEVEPAANSIVSAPLAVASGTEVLFAEQHSMGHPAQAPGSSILYSEIFDLKARSSWEKTIELIKLGGFKIEELGKFKEEIHRLRGAAKLVSAAQTEKLLSALEEVLEEYALRDLSKLPQEIFDKTSGVFQNGLSALWVLRERFEKGETEDAVLAHEEMKRTFQEALDSADLFKFDLGFLPARASGAA